MSTVTENPVAALRELRERYGHDDDDHRLQWLLDQAAELTAKDGEAAARLLHTALDYVEVNLREGDMHSAYLLVAGYLGELVAECQSRGTLPEYRHREPR